MTDAGYKDWERITYRPAIADLLPSVVLEHLHPGSAALDIGCNTGGVSLFLAAQGMRVLGIDINESAINSARRRVDGTVLAGSADFRVSDILIDPVPGPFDIVLLIRVLTCFPDALPWEALLRRAWELIRIHGYVYIHDFLLAPESENYRPRYEAGARVGWRWGNFAVNAANGDLLFVAHHHTEEDLARIFASYRRIHFATHESLSMNGNACRMFEFLGRRTE